MAESGEWVASLLERVGKPPEEHFPGDFDRCLYDYERALLELLCLDLLVEETDAPAAEEDGEGVLVDAQLSARHSEAVETYVKARTTLRVALKSVRAGAGLEPAA